MMGNFIGPRWRKPAVSVALGAVLAAACAIRGGPHWWLWVSLVAIAAAGRAFAFWAWAGEDDDIAALAGTRADERQKQLSLRSRALACNVTALAAFAGLTAGVALNAIWWWPFAAVLGVLGFGYLLGLASYGVAEESQADDRENQPQSPAPAGR